MDIQQFDELIRSLAADSPRRRLLAGLTRGIVVALALGLTHLDTVAKRKRRRKRKKRKEGRCPNGTRPCGKQCIPSANCCAESDCPAGANQICQGGACACAPGQQDSGGVCGTPPTCEGFRSSCSDPAECCSNVCEFDMASLLCGSSGQGRPCHTTSDCNPGLNCVGFICMA